MKEMDLIRINFISLVRNLSVLVLFSSIFNFKLDERFKEFY